jgi:O-antigen ligase
MKKVPVLQRISLFLFIAIPIAAVSVFLPEKYLPFPVIIGILSILAATLFLRPVWLIPFVVLFSPIICTLRHIETINLSGTTISLSGLVWAFTAGACVLFLAAHPSRTRIPVFIVPFLAFVGWTFVSWLASNAPLTGLKDILFYGLPPLFGVFTVRVVSRTDGGWMGTIEKLILLTIFIPIGIYLLSIPAGWVSITIKGPEGFIEPRGIALYLLVVLAVALSRWSYATTASAKKTAVIFAWMTLATIFFTLSRMAGMTALLLLSLAIIKPHRIREGLLSVVAAGIVGMVIIFTVPALQERFFHQTSSDLWSTLLSLRTAGRNIFWPITFEHAAENPLIGWGPGSARILVAKSQPILAAAEYHPHNEYLQVFHDTGIIGLILLLLAYIPLFFHFWRQWRTSHSTEHKSLAARSMAAFLSIVAVLVTSATANTLHYAFVTVPAFILIAFAYRQNRHLEGNATQPVPFHPGTDSG